MEKTKTCRHGLKRLLAFLLSTLCLLGLLPMSAFAMEPGQTASSWLGDQYVGSDGQHYYSPAPYTYLVYNSDGTMDVRTSSGGSGRTKRISARVRGCVKPSLHECKNTRSGPKGDGRDGA